MGLVFKLNVVQVSKLQNRLRRFNSKPEKKCVILLDNDIQIHHY